MISTINVSVDSDIRFSAENIFSKFGISLTDAIKIFLHKSVMEGGLPFDMKIKQYNAETIEAIEEAKAIREGRIQTKSYSSARELFDELDKECEAE